MGQGEPWGSCSGCGAGGSGGSLPRMCVSPAAPPQLTSCKGCFLGPLDMLLFNNAGVQTGGHISGFWRSCVKCQEAVVPPGVVFFKTAF